MGGDLLSLRLIILLTLENQEIVMMKIITQKNHCRRDQSHTESQTCLWALRDAQTKTSSHATAKSPSTRSLKFYRL